MSDADFHFWRDHSDNYLTMAFSTDHLGRLERPDGYGRHTGDCGDTVAFYLSVQGDRLFSIQYEAEGCMNTHACANTVIHLAEHAPIAEAWDITPETVAAFLQTLPASHFHCAELAVGAFYKALASIQQRGRKHKG